MKDKLWIPVWISLIVFLLVASIYTFKSNTMYNQVVALDSLTNENDSLRFMLEVCHDDLQMLEEKELFNE